jgi:RNA polymerase sigma-70 factor (ECF subfamily)
MPRTPCRRRSCERGHEGLPRRRGPASPSRRAVDPGAPDTRYEQRETLELAFLAALPHLPARQRAALLLWDVLAFTAAEAARTLDTTPVLDAAVRCVVAGPRDPRRVALARAGLPPAVGPGGR